ncbi:MAG: GAF domain-containing protein, partial [Bacteroidota bacterium]
QEATYFTQKIVAQRFDVNYSPDFQKGVLEQALVRMQKALKKASLEKQTSNWLDKNLAQFIDVFKKHQELTPLSQEIIQRLSKQVKAQQGAIFLNTEVLGQARLKLVAGYALSRERYQKRNILAHEGLLGQALKNRNSIYLDQLPENYNWIEMGLGNTPPRSLFICPIQINEETLGVIELSSLYCFDLHHQQIVERIADYMAWFIARKNIQTNP